jgi:hypothetical protein
MLQHCCPLPVNPEDAERQRGIVHDAQYAFRVWDDALFLQKMPAIKLTRFWQPES